MLQCGVYSISRFLRKPMGLMGVVTLRVLKPSPNGDITLQSQFRIGIPNIIHATSLDNSTEK